MIIANPIYDVVFKYLLEDANIARDLLSTILGEEVVQLEFKPQETSTESSDSIKILRLDFKAIIKKKDGSLFKVLIELQKSKQVFDVMRFRRYLGDNYRKEDQMIDKDGDGAITKAEFASVAGRMEEAMGKRPGKDGNSSGGVKPKRPIE